MIKFQNVFMFSSVYNNQLSNQYDILQIVP